MLLRVVVAIQVMSKILVWRADSGHRNDVAQRVVSRSVVEFRLEMMSVLRMKARRCTPRLFPCATMWRDVLWHNTLQPSPRETSTPSVRIHTDDSRLNCGSEEGSQASILCIWSFVLLPSTCDF